ncbi:hypothetical protein [Alishewanella longhuensis]
MQTLSYNKRGFPLPGVELEFADAGHILGSAIVQLWLKGKQRLRVSGVFPRFRLICDCIVAAATEIPQADIVLMESTYGNRDHQPSPIPLKSLLLPYQKRMTPAVMCLFRLLP